MASRFKLMMDSVGFTASSDCDDGCDGTCADECNTQTPPTIPEEWDGPAHPNLEVMLELEDEDAERTSRVMDAIEERIAVDPSVEMLSAKCGTSFCRAVLARPLDSELAWEDIDRRLVDVATGMTWIRAEEDGQGGTVAYIYFAEGDESLPL